MGEMLDYACRAKEEQKLEEGELEKLGLSLPEAHKSRETLVALAKAWKEKRKGKFCELPFDHMVEAEAMGGVINYGDSKAGPRAGDYCCRSMEEVLQLSDIDFTAGRIKEVLDACRILKEQGEAVLLEISGPFTILNGLVDPRQVFKAMRKQPETADQVFEKLKRNILAFAKKAQEAGADLLSYADSSGGISILGPRLGEEVAKKFTAPMLKELKDKKKDMTVVLCPKTALALVGAGLADWEEVQVEEGPVSYGEACLRIRGKADFTGQMCIKEAEELLQGGKVRVLSLREG